MSTLSSPARLLVHDGRELRGLEPVEVRARLGFELTLNLHFADDAVRRAIARDAAQAAGSRLNRRLLERHGQDLRAPERLLARVYVADAGALGRGLFAVDELPRDTLVATYAGEVVREQDADPSDPYVLSYHRSLRCPSGLWCRASGHELDLSARQRGGPARFINSGTLEAANLLLQVVACDGALVPVFTTARRVLRHEQLRWDYGEAYWARWSRSVVYSD